MLPLVSCPGARAGRQVLLFLRTAYLKKELLNSPAPSPLPGGGAWSPDAPFGKHFLYNRYGFELSSALSFYLSGFPGA